MMQNKKLKMKVKHKSSCYKCCSSTRTICVCELLVKMKDHNVEDQTE